MSKHRASYTYQLKPCYDNINGRQLRRLTVPVSFDTCGQRCPIHHLYTKQALGVVSSYASTPNYVSGINRITNGENAALKLTLCHKVRRPKANTSHEQTNHLTCCTQSCDISVGESNLQLYRYLQCDIN